MTRLEYHQARLLASSVRREIRKALKKPTQAPQRIENAARYTSSLIDLLKTRA